jgi:hypothetical protein
MNKDYSISDTMIYILNPKTLAEFTVSEDLMLGWEDLYRKVKNYFEDCGLEFENDYLWYRDLVWKTYHEVLNIELRDLISRMKAGNIWLKGRKVNRQYWEGYVLYEAMRRKAISFGYSEKQILGYDAEQEFLKIFEDLVEKMSNVDLTSEYINLKKGEL